MLRRSRHVAASSEEARDGYIFIDGFPMQTNTTQLDLFAFR
jgi:hypothetical protein